MKRNLVGTLSLVVMSLLLNVNGAYAQSAVKANVPFPFNVVPPNCRLVATESRSKTAVAWSCSGTPRPLPPCSRLANKSVLAAKAGNSCFGALGTGTS